MCQSELVCDVSVAVDSRSWRIWVWSGSEWFGVGSEWFGGGSEWFGFGVHWTDNSSKMVDQTIVARWSNRQ